MVEDDSPPWTTTRFERSPESGLLFSLGHDVDRGRCRLQRCDGIISLNRGSRLQLIRDRTLVRGHDRRSVLRQMLHAFVSVWLFPRRDLSKDLIISEITLRCDGGKKVSRAAASCAVGYF